MAGLAATAGSPLKYLAISGRVAPMTAEVTTWILSATPIVKAII